MSSTAEGQSLSTAEGLGESDWRDGWEAPEKKKEMWKVRERHSTFHLELKSTFFFIYIYWDRAERWI